MTRPTPTPSLTPSTHRCIHVRVNNAVCGGRRAAHRHLQPRSGARASPRHQRWRTRCRAAAPRPRRRPDALLRTPRPGTPERRVREPTGASGPARPPTAAQHRLGRRGQHQRCPASPPALAEQRRGRAAPPRPWARSRPAWHGRAWGGGGAKVSEGGRGAACLERLGFDRAGVGTKQSRRVPAARRSNRHERRRLPQGPCKARGRVWVAGRGGLSPGPAARPAAANHAPVAQRCSAAAAAVAAATSPAATTVAATVAASTPAARRQQRSRAGSTGPPHQACTVAGAGSSPRLAARAAPGGRRRSSGGGPTAPRHDARKAAPTTLRLCHTDLLSRWPPG